MRSSFSLSNRNFFLLLLLLLSSPPPPSSSASSFSSAHWNLPHIPPPRGERRCFFPLFSFRFCPKGSWGSGFVRVSFLWVAVGREDGAKGGFRGGKVSSFLVLPAHHRRPWSVHGLRIRALFCCPGQQYHCKMYNGSESMTAEAYMIPGSSSNQQLVLAPSFPGTGSMANEVAPEFTVDQGLYYSAAAPNYYGYYCTGFDSPGESDDRHRFFGLDGQDLHCLDMQTESLPFVYYTPSYGYTHSPYNPYNPYNPYIPGAVIGVDGPYVGTQQYVTNVAYQQPISSPTYFPVVVHSGEDITPNVAPDPLVFNAVGSGATVPGTISVKFTPPASVAAASTMQLPDSVTSGPVLPHTPDQLHQSETLKVSLVDAAHRQRPAFNGAVASGVLPHAAQLHFRGAAGSVQALNQLKSENVFSVPSSSKDTVTTYNGSPNLEPSMHEWAAADGVRPRLHFAGIINNHNGSPNMLGEQNRGPRTGRSKGPCSSLVVRGYTTKAGAYNTEGNITIYPEQYNREDFPVNYPDAKFFVIKSYSEDDVHKSIKYNVWSSTPSGNKRLDSAYEDAQRLSGGDLKKCPIFLFFSVNASGQFCGVAEMMGPVDFNRDMDFWQQDKWTGSFPVKWHIIKDVPNASFRHIILENNENKPVTNSRDTQEVRYMPGTSMLTIFKSSPLKTSILDDFMYYEERQRIVYEEKIRLLGRSFGDTSFSQPFGPPKRSIVTIKRPMTQERRTEPNDNAENSDTAAIVAGDTAAKSEHTCEANNKQSTPSEAAQGGGVVSPVMKLGSLSLDSEKGQTSESATSTAAASEAVEYVTVGSMPVKVNGYAESSPGILTTGTLPVNPKTAE